MLEVNSEIRIPLRELEIDFVRASGPGGQNVNKVNTKAVLRWSVDRTPSLPEDVRQRLRAAYRRRINQRGELIIHSQRFRDQARNVADCLMKLRELVLSVAEAPQVRRPTRPSKAARKRRLRDKRHRSEIKARRGRPGSDD